MSYATTEKVKAAFEAAGERMDGVDRDVDNLKTALVEMQKMVRMFYKSGAAFQENAAQNKTVWANEAQAKQFADFVLNVVRHKDMTEAVNADGGVLVPDEMASRIIDLKGRYGKFRRNATRVSLGSEKALVPMITGDLTVYAPGESHEITKSDMQFGLITMTPKKWGILAAVSSELEEDAVIGMAEILGRSIARSMAKKEDECAFIGDGTSTYFGVTGICAALKGVDETIGNIKGLKVGTGNLYSELTLADFEGVVALLPEQFDEDAKWYMSKKFYYSVIWPLAQTAGVANIFEILSDRKSRYLLGYEVEFVHCMPSVQADSQVCAVLGDLAMGSYLGERRQVSVARSEHVFFSQDMMAFRATQRISINNFGVGNTTEAGPIVGLITAAS